jgi:uncharacterized LabA/DUF88 family protein
MTFVGNIIWNYMLPYHSMIGIQRVMLFVDGENLAIRYKEIKKDMEPYNIKEKVVKEKNKEMDIYVWPTNKFHMIQGHPNYYVIRSYYYTCVKGDNEKIDEIKEELKILGFQSPCVYKKIGGKSKKVDIGLCVDVLTQASLDNFDICVLVTGDRDFVPLIQAVKKLGKMVVVWFFEKNIVKELIYEADHFFKLSNVFFEKDGMIPKPRGISVNYESKPRQ